MNPKMLLARMDARFPESEPKLTEFSSGAFILDLMISGLDYCVEYFPSEQAFGLSKTGNASPFFEGVEESFSSPDALEARIAELLSGNR